MRVGSLHPQAYDISEIHEKQGAKVLGKPKRDPKQPYPKHTTPYLKPNIPHSKTREPKLSEKQARNACVQLLRSCLHWYVNTVLSGMYSYFRKGCRKAYAPIPLGIQGVYAWVLIERQPFLNQLYIQLFHLRLSQLKCTHPDRKGACEVKISGYSTNDILQHGNWSGLGPNNRFVRLDNIFSKFFFSMDFSQCAQMRLTIT